MSQPYPPPPPRKLERSTTDKVVGGVCGGVARYLNLDPTVVRVLTVVLTLIFGFPAVVYLVARFVMPEEHRGPADRQRPPLGAYPPQPGAGTWTQPAHASDPVWGSEGAPWEQTQPVQQPLPPTTRIDPDGAGGSAQRSFGS